MTFDKLKSLLMAHNFGMMHKMTPMEGRIVQALHSPFSLRKVSSSVLHVCAARITKKHEIHHIFGQKVVGIENNSYLRTVTIMRLRYARGI